MNIENNRDMKDLIGLIVRINNREKITDADARIFKSLFDTHISNYDKYQLAGADVSDAERGSILDLICSANSGREDF